MRLPGVLLAFGFGLLPTAVGRPNILFMLADDLGYGDLGCYRSTDIPTPNIDRLARSGARLTSWYAQAYCTPSRYSLLTGRHPNRAPDLINALNRLADADRGKGLQPGETTVAELLGKAGYRSTLLGKWHLGHGTPEFFPTRHGFERFFGHTGGCVDMFTLRYGNTPDWFEAERLTDARGYATDVVTEAAVRFLRAQRSNAPFFLYLAFAAPHYGKGWDENKRTPINILQAKPQSVARMSSIPNCDRRIYAAMVVELDDAVGQILTVLDAQGLAENTWVIFASDNGADLDYGGSNGPLNGEKGTLWEGGIRVPCLMRWPGRITPGTVNTQPAMALDFLPTVCRLAGVDTADLVVDGVDLAVPLFNGGQLERDVFHWRGEDASLRRGDWKYLRRGGKDMLFNLAADLGEKENLAEVRPNVLAELKSAHAAIAATLHGPNR